MRGLPRKGIEERVMETKPSLLDAIQEAVRGPGWAPGRRAPGGRMPSLEGATGWLNSPPLTTDGLRGRVVAVDFWTTAVLQTGGNIQYDLSNPEIADQN